MPGSRGLLPLLLVATACAVPEETGPTEPEWIALFDGASLDGWTPKVRGYAAGEDPLRTFRVRDGAIVVDYGDYEGRFEDRFGHLFHDMPWEAYRLRVEYRFVGEQMVGGPGWAWRNSAAGGWPSAWCRCSASSRTSPPLSSGTRRPACPPPAPRRGAEPWRPSPRCGTVS